MLGLAYLMLDCWPEISLHPEGTATGQLNQGLQPELSFSVKKLARALTVSGHFGLLRLFCDCR
jgi:hypothetical protein